jgi:hypothetical protein
MVLAAALAIVIFAAACHPEEVKKVQEELESVVGNGRSGLNILYFIQGSLLLLTLVNPHYQCQLSMIILNFRWWRPSSVKHFDGDLPLQLVCVFLQEVCWSHD